MSRSTKQSNVSVLWHATRDPVIRELIDMHRYRRPGRSATEAAFCEKYIEPLPNVWKDTAGNWIGCIGENPVVLWSSHTDTVHRKDGMQKLAIDSNTDSLFVSSKETDSSCLGADCTVGVWLMRQMYQERIPGLYIWHAEEETGGIGSTHIAAKSRELLTGVQAAIAFDRKGYDSVITHQFMDRTASDAFAASLAAQLGGKYKADSGGTFTDTANYADIIPECTNVSVGYHNAHCSNEWLSLTHALDLLGAVRKLDVSRLVIQRDPSVVEPRAAYSGWTSTSRRWHGDDVWGGNTYYGGTAGSLTDSTFEAMEKADMRALVRENPFAVADLLIELNYSVDDIRNWIR